MVRNEGTGRLQAAPVDVPRRVHGKRLHDPLFLVFYDSTPMTLTEAQVVEYQYFGMSQSALVFRSVLVERRPFSFSVVCGVPPLHFWGST